MTRGLRGYCGWILVGLALGIAWRPASLSAQKVALKREAYLAPPEIIAKSVLAPWHENISLTNLSPDGTKFLITKSDGMPSLEAMARPFVNLGEREFDHIAHRSRRLTTRNSVGYDLYDYEADKSVPVEVPDGARVSSAAWSPRGDQLAFFAHFKDATHLYVADTSTGKSKQVTPSPVLATNVTSFKWSMDGKSIQVVLLPEDAARPQPGEVASEPQVRVARDGKIPSRTYRFLLQSPYDMAHLEYLSRGQLVVIQIGNGTMTKVGDPSMLMSVNTAPKADYFRVTTMRKPFSYFVPMSRFGSQDTMQNKKGETVRTFSTRELRDGPPTPTQQPPSPRRGPPTARPSSGPDNPQRSLRWRPDGNGMSFLQREPAKKKEESDDKEQDSSSGDDADESDEEEPEPRKDRVMQWLPPFGDDDVKVVYESDDPISSVAYSEDCKTLFITQTKDNRRITYAVYLKKPKDKHIIFSAASSSSSRSDSSDPRRPGTRRPPGSPAATQNAAAPAAKPQDDKDAKPQATDDKGKRKQRRKKKGGGKKKKKQAADSAGKADDKKDAAKKADDKKAKEPEARGASKGSLMTRRARSGESVVRISRQGDVYFSGSEDADEEKKLLARPYIDKVNIKTGKVERIFEGKGKISESISTVNGDNITRVFTVRQNTDVVPDSYVYDVESKKARKLTQNKNFTPWYQKLEVERFQVERVDGFKFWVRVTRNPDYGMRLPAVFWFYPREYTDQASYDRSRSRSRSSSNRFSSPSTRSMTHLTQIGYVVVEPDLPIVGPDERMNDNFVPDLRNGLWAVIDALDKRDLIDRDRLAIGGHSYGAFGTANAMAHTPFFKAGIAGDGNFNRTLTPMAFQRERRYFWDARETYIRMSPLFWANQVNGALLMYHGAEDANVGTWPIHSERMFQALDGLGKPASLYMYPYEGHGPAARETTLDLWARWVAWLELYVQHPEKKKEDAESDD